MKSSAHRVLVHLHLAIVLLLLGSGTQLLAQYGSFVGGGVGNAASADFSTVAGGDYNTASGYSSAITGGEGNTASGNYSSQMGGRLNNATGAYSTVAGGVQNTASGNFSFAAGYRANANQDGAIVFATGNVNSWPAFAAHRFEVFATHGACFDANETPGTNWVCLVVDADIPGQQISTSSGAFLTTGGTWVNASDRNAKRDFAGINPKSVLEQVAELPMTEWSYKAEDAKIRHVGPMAQDFYAAFHLGFDDKHIGTIDEGGVALAAIQGLNQKLEEALQQKDAEIVRDHEQLAAQQQQMDALQQQVNEMLARVEAVEKAK